MKFIILLSAFLLLGLSTADKQQVEPLGQKNYLLNGGFESGTSRWTTTTGGSISTPISPIINGKASGLFTTEAGVTLESERMAIDLYNSGEDCNASLSYMYTGAGNDFTFRVLDDGDSVLATAGSISSSIAAEVSLDFTCPSSGDVRISVLANAGTAGVPLELAIDNAWLGMVRATSGGGGGGALNDLSDVDAGSPSNDEVLTYNSTSGNWENKVASGGGSGDVVGPASSTNNRIALFDGTTGKLLKVATEVDIVGAAMQMTEAGIIRLGAAGKFERDTLTLGNFYGRTVAFTLQPVQFTSYTLTMPITTPGNNKILETNSGGQLSWIDTPTTGNTYQVVPALDVVFSSADVFYKAISTNSTFTFSSQTNGDVVVLAVENTSGGDVTATLPASLWSGGTIVNNVVANSTTIFTITRIANNNYITAIEDMK